MALRDGKLLIACRDALGEVSTLSPPEGKLHVRGGLLNGYCRAANKDGCGRAVSLFRIEDRGRALFSKVSAHGPSRKNVDWWGRPRTRSPVARKEKKYLP